MKTRIHQWKCTIKGEVTSTDTELCAIMQLIPMVFRWKFDQWMTRVTINMCKRVKIFSKRYHVGTAILFF